MINQDSRENLQSIARTVKRANISKDFALIIAECNSLEEQRKYVEQLRQMCGKDGVVLTEVNLLEKPPTERLLPIVKDHLEKEFGNRLPQKLGIQVTGLELSILLDEDEEAPAVLQILNINRESYYHDLPFPFIFWLPEYACIKVANAAPDFWSFRVGAAAFCTDETSGTLLPKSIENGKSLTVWQDKQAQIPVLERLLNTHPSPEVLVDLLIKSADAYYYLAKTDKAQQRYEQAIEENKKAKGKPQGVAEAYNKLGLIYSDLETDGKNLEKAEKSLRQYLEIVESMDRTDLVTMGYNHLGLIYDKHKEYHQALQAYRKAQDISRKHGHRKLEGDVLGNLGLLYRKQEKYEDALNMHQQALTISREMDDIQGEAIDLSNIGLIYSEQKDHQKAIDYYNQALLNNVRIGNKLEEMNQLILLGDAWKALGDFSKALEKYNSAKAIARGININIFTIWDRLEALFGPGALEDSEQEMFVLKGAIEESRQSKKTDKELQYWERLCEIYQERREIIEKNNCLMHMESLIKKQLRHLEDEDKIIGCYEKLSKIYRELGKKKELDTCKQKLDELDIQQIIAWFEPGTVEMKGRQEILQVGKMYRLNLQVVRTPPQFPLLHQEIIPSFKKPQRLVNIIEQPLIEGRRISAERTKRRQKRNTTFENKIEVGAKELYKKDSHIHLRHQEKISKIQSPSPPPYISGPFSTAVSFHFESPGISFDRSNIDVSLNEKSNKSDVGSVNITPKTIGEQRISINARVDKYRYGNNFSIPLRIQRIRRTKSHELTIEDLDRELIARGAQIPFDELFKFMDTEGTPARHAVMAGIKELYKDSSFSSNPALSSIDTWELAKLLIYKTRQIEENRKRGIWYEDHRMDTFSIVDEPIKRNIDCAAAIMLKDDLIDEKDGYSTIKVKNYGKVFNLYEGEAFREQPITAGRMHTGFLVEKDIIATAGHSLYRGNIKDFRIVFGYKMSNPSNPVLKVPNENIYKGINIIGRSYIPRGSGADWALLKLDRKVEGQEVAVLSEDVIWRDQPVYVIGYPMGLPLKYAPGAKVRDFKDTLFAADLDVYMSSVGSPVINSDTHKVIGMVVHGDTQDFRWTGRGWATIIYPTRRPMYSSGLRCAMVAGIIDAL